MVNAVISQVNRANKATMGEVASIKPNVEATPLPPLNFNQMGKLCPSTPHVPAIKDAVILICVAMPQIIISLLLVNFNAVTTSDKILIVWYGCQLHGLEFALSSEVFQEILSCEHAPDA